MNEDYKFPFSEVFGKAYKIQVVHYGRIDISKTYEFIRRTGNRETYCKRYGLEECSK